MSEDDAGGLDRQSPEEPRAPSRVEEDLKERLALTKSARLSRESDAEAAKGGKGFFIKDFDICNECKLSIRKLHDPMVEAATHRAPGLIMLCVEHLILEDLFARLPKALTIELVTVGVDMGRRDRLPLDDSSHVCRITVLKVVLKFCRKNPIL